MTHARLQQPLVSNGYTLSTAPERLGWLEPSDPRAPMSALREQYAAQGYLWLKGILKREDVLAFRGRYFAALADTGLLAPGSDPVEGIYSGGGERNDLIRRAQHEIVRWAAYEAFCLAPAIWQFYEAFFGSPVYLHKRKLIRHVRPGDTASTGAHYDLVYLRGGTDTVCTSWIPLGDTPIAMGGLVYLENSHRYGREMEADFAARNADLPPDERISAFNKNMGEVGWLTKDLPALADKIDSRWLIADYEAGDMVIHGAYTIHAATDNVAPDGRLRLSTDIRYQDVRAEIDARWSNHWSLDDML
jgi:ectoine hydroxylase-related dioxygenase (phytanoyl-CoA dioxygenase family)